jgi:hypothetical protein
METEYDKDLLVGCARALFPDDPALERSPPFDVDTFRPLDGRCTIARALLCLVADTDNVSGATNVSLYLLDGIRYAQTADPDVLASLKASSGLDDATAAKEWFRKSALARIEKAVERLRQFGGGIHGIFGDDCDGFLSWSATTVLVEENERPEGGVPDGSGYYKLLRNGPRGHEEGLFIAAVEIRQRNVPLSTTERLRLFAALAELRARTGELDALPEFREAIDCLFNDPATSASLSTKGRLTMLAAATGDRSLFERARDVRGLSDDCPGDVLNYVNGMIDASLGGIMRESDLASAFALLMELEHMDGASAIFALAYYQKHPVQAMVGSVLLHLRSQDTRANVPTEVAALRTLGFLALSFFFSDEMLHNRRNLAVVAADYSARFVAGSSVSGWDEGLRLYTLSALLVIEDLAEMGFAADVEEFENNILQAVGVVGTSAMMIHEMKVHRRKALRFRRARGAWGPQTEELLLRGLNRTPVVAPAEELLGLVEEVVQSVDLLQTAKGRTEVEQYRNRFFETVGNLQAHLERIRETLRSLGIDPTLSMKRNLEFLTLMMEFVRDGVSSVRLHDSAYLTVVHAVAMGLRGPATEVTVLKEASMIRDNIRYQKAQQWYDRSRMAIEQCAALGLGELMVELVPFLLGSKLLLRNDVDVASVSMANDLSFGIYLSEKFLFAIRDGGRNPKVGALMDGGVRLIVFSLALGIVLLDHAPNRVRASFGDGSARLFEDLQSSSGADFDEQYSEWLSFVGKLSNGLRPSEPGERTFVAICGTGGLSKPPELPGLSPYSLLVTAEGRDILPTVEPRGVWVFFHGEPDLKERLDEFMAGAEYEFPGRFTVMENELNLNKFWPRAGDLVIVLGHISDQNGCVLRTGLLHPNGASLTGDMIIQNNLLEGCEVLLVGCGGGRGNAGGSRSQQALASAILLSGATGVTAATIPVDAEPGLRFAASWMRDVLGGASPSLAVRNARELLKESEHFSAAKHWGCWVHLV